MGRRGKVCLAPSPCLAPSRGGQLPRRTHFLAVVIPGTEFEALLPSDYERHQDDPKALEDFIRNKYIARKVRPGSNRGAPSPSIGPRWNSPLAAFCCSGAPAALATAR